MSIRVRPRVIGQVGFDMQPRSVKFLYMLLPDALESYIVFPLRTITNDIYVFPDSVRQRFVSSS